MGQIASDYFKKYGSAYITENPFTVEELTVRMDLMIFREDMQGSWIQKIPIFPPNSTTRSLLRDRAFSQSVGPS